ncbi:MAG: MjaI family restriction endonuclease [Desulfobacteraceae bacterium]|nr:MjaI family restriction endonuclease [Desulfobacteraceae bacterium]MBC2755677.1 MjaI family restriction endonuclease [Desulfobacteraceae bacterium]
MADVAETPEVFPKYTTQLINLANQNSQATRPCYVGQMSELIQEFPGNSYSLWVQWYIAKYPDAIDQATDRTYTMIRKMQQAMAEIDRDMVRQWVQELILSKTYAGLRFQESILKAIAEKKSTTYRLARPEEESKGIDGFIGMKPVSIKPVSYQSKTFLTETIDATIIYYEKVRGGIKVFYGSCF